MISNPNAGWCDFQIGNFVGHPSYLTNVPVDLLDAFINARKMTASAVTFDEEGSSFTLVISRYNLEIFIIEEDESEKLHSFPQLRIDDLEEECICDIENNLDKWASEFSMGEMEEITKNKEEIKKKIDELAMLRNRKKESIDIER